MKRVEINELQFKKLIDVVKHCVSKDDYRPVLGYIQIKVKPDTITAYALDGSRAARVEIKNTFPIDEEFTCLIKPFTFKVSKRGINPVVIECTGENTFVEVVTEHGALRYGFAVPSGEFPDVEKIYETARQHDRKQRRHYKRATYFTRKNTGERLKEIKDEQRKSIDSSKKCFRAGNRKPKRKG